MTYGLGNPLGREICKVRNRGYQNAFHGAAACAAAVSRYSARVNPSHADGCTNNPGEWNHYYNSQWTATLPNPIPHDKDVIVGFRNKTYQSDNYVYIEYRKKGQTTWNNLGGWQQGGGTVGPFRYPGETLEVRGTLRHGTASAGDVCDTKTTEITWEAAPPTPTCPSCAEHQFCNSGTNYQCQWIRRCGYYYGSTAADEGKLSISIGTGYDCKRSELGYCRINPDGTAYTNANITMLTRSELGGYLSVGFAGNVKVKVVTGGGRVVHEQTYACEVGSPKFPNDANFLTFTKPSDSDRIIVSYTVDGQRWGPNSKYECCAGSASLEYRWEAPPPSCPTCGSDQYCDSSTNYQCVNKQCPTCPSYQYCSGSATNWQCVNKQCPTCSAGQYCSGSTTDWQCVDKTCPSCQSHQYCSGSATNWLCVDKTCPSCNTGYYCSGSATNWQCVAKTCPSTCPSGTYCSGYLTDGQCVERQCPTCSAGQYCSGAATNWQCVSPACPSCNTGYYCSGALTNYECVPVQTSGGTNTSSGIQRCPSTCPTGYYCSGGLTGYQCVAQSTGGEPSPQCPAWCPEVGQVCNASTGYQCVAQSTSGGAGAGVTWGVIALVGVGAALLLLS